MRRTLVLCVLLVVGSIHAAYGEIPRTINYQGVLMEDGTIVPDGEYEITFRLYDTPEGGSLLWEEPDTVSVTDGVFSAILGKTVPLDLNFDATYWLGMSIGGDPELTPTVELTGSPYAFRAAVADVGEDSDWVIDGDDIYREIGMVGIGTSTPSYELDVVGDIHSTGLLKSGNSITIDGVNDRITASSGKISFAGDDLVTGGQVGIGTPTPTEDLDVIGSVRMMVFKMPPGAQSGYVLTSDASGVGTWAPEAGDITAVYAGIGLSGGATSGDATLDVQVPLSLTGSDPGPIIRGTNTGSGLGLFGEAMGNGGRGVYGYALASSGTNFGVYGRTNSSAGYAGYFEGRGYFSGDVGIGTPAPAEELDVAGTVQMTGFKMPTGASPGWVLTSNAAGVGTWALGGGGGLPPGTSGQTLRHNGTAWVADSLLYNNSTNVGVATASPSQKLDVDGKMEVGDDSAPATGGAIRWTIDNGFEGYDGSTWKALDVQSTGGGWSLTGNAGTVPGTNFLGTTDNQALQLHVNNARALRIEPDATSPNLIGGYGSNIVTSGVYGATIAGGGASGANINNVTDYHCTVGGGKRNQAGDAAYDLLSAQLATVGGGFNNTAGARCATVAGGSGNVAGVPGQDYATVGGGYINIADGEYAFIGGGWLNTASDFAATVGGGYGNDIVSGNSSTIGGGYENRVAAGSATVPGGSYNYANGANSFAAGKQARADHDGAFVWSDRGGFAFHSAAANEFAVRCIGGARFVSAIDGSGNPTAGVQLAPGGGSWSSISDRNAKANLEYVNGREIVARLAEMPVTTWNYKSQDPSIRHMGPMAQDFAAAFKIGEDDRHIATVDADGVALAAIQGLYRLLQEKDARIAALEQRVDELESRMTALEK